MSAEKCPEGQCLAGFDDEDWKRQCMRPVTVSETPAHRHGLDYEFNYCPECGHPIDWKALKKEALGT